MRIGSAYERLVNGDTGGGGNGYRQQNPYSRQYHQQQDFYRQQQQYQQYPVRLILFASPWYNDSCFAMTHVFFSAYSHSFTPSSKQGKLTVSVWHLHVPQTGILAHIFAWYGPICRAQQLAVPVLVHDARDLRVPGLDLHHPPIAERGASDQSAIAIELKQQQCQCECEASKPSVNCSMRLLQRHLTLTPVVPCVCLCYY